MGRFSRAIVAIVVFALLAVACSSSAKSHVDVNKVLTKAEYIKESDTICANYRDRINGIVGSAGSGLSLSAAKAVFTQRLIPLFEAEHEELIRLRAPKADAKKLAGALVAMSSGINTIVGRVNGATSITDLNAINPKGIGRWKYVVGNYGMHICGSKPTTTTT
jgi:hypothetical protein